MKRKRLTLVLDAESHEEANDKLLDCWINITTSKTRFGCNKNHIDYITTYLANKLDNAYMLYFYRNLPKFKHMEPFPIQHDLINKGLKKLLKEREIDPISTQLNIRFDV